MGAANEGSVSTIQGSGEQPQQLPSIISPNSEPLLSTVKLGDQMRGSMIAVQLPHMVNVFVDQQLGGKLTSQYLSSFIKLGAAFFESGYLQDTELMYELVYNMQLNGLLLDQYGEELEPALVAAERIYEGTEWPRQWYSLKSRLQGLLQFFQRKGNPTVKAAAYDLQRIQFDAKTSPLICPLCDIELPRNESILIHFQDVHHDEFPKDLLGYRELLGKLRGAFGNINIVYNRIVVHIQLEDPDPKAPAVDSGEPDLPWIPDPLKRTKTE